MKIGIIGIYYGDNLMQGMLRCFEDAGLADNTHLLCLDSNVPLGLRRYTRLVSKGKKFALLNQLSKYVMDCDLVLVVDDDIKFSKSFFPGYVNCVVRYGFDLAQPALTLDSHYSHKITLQDTCEARRTNFVEIGPMFSMTKRCFHHNLPFPPTMGHGLDYWWSVDCSVNGFIMGVVDSFPVEHKHRKVGQNYNQMEAGKDMARLMYEKRMSTFPAQQTIQRYEN